MKKKKVYYGWWVVVVCFLMIFITLGFGSYSKSTYLKAICDDLGYARSAFAINDSLRYIATAVMSFIFGTVVVKINPRLMVALGFLFLIISFTIYCLATELWQFYLGGIFLGAGFAWTGTSIVGYIIGKWFPNNKGTIMGVVLASNGLGGALSEIIITPIVLDGEKLLNGNGLTSKLVCFLSRLTGITDGWRLGYFITIVLCLLTAIVVVLVIRTQPSDKGLEPLILNKVKSSKKKSLDWGGYDLKVILRKPYFYMSAACVFVFGFVLQSSSGIAKPHMQQYNFSTEAITLLFSFGAIVLTFSKIFTGVLFDKWGIKVVILFCGTCAVISTLCLSLITSFSLAPAWIYSILSPLALPLETIVIPLLVSQMFGNESYASVLGYYLAINMVGYATGAPIINLFYDICGSYNAVLIAQTVLVFIATVVSIVSIILADKDRIKFIALKEEGQLVKNQNA